MRKAKIAFWIILTGILAAVTLRGISRCLGVKGAGNKNSDFYSVADECDVLFLGSSHMTLAVYPLELWHDYGITSYNLSGYGCPLPLTYWMFMNALDYADPKVVVVDCFHLDSDQAAIRDRRYMHYSLDSIPLSRTKVRTICDLFDDFESRSEYLWKFSLYHNRWDELTRDDFEPEGGKSRGALFEIGVCEPADFLIKDVVSEPIESVGVEYLRKLVEECQSRGIKVILTFLPFPAPEDQQKAAAYAGELAREYGVDYLNFLQMDVVNYQTDCFDADSHLNVSGGQKITSYMGRYLREHCGDAADRRQDGLVDWDEDYDLYHRDKVDRLNGQESLHNYLVAAADKDFSICFWADGRSRMWDYEQYVDLVRNLAPGYAFSALNEAAGQEEDYFLMIDNKNGMIVDYYGDSAAEIETSFGRMVYTAKEDGQKALFLGDSEESFITDPDAGGEDLTVQVLVIDNRDGAVVSRAGFSEMFRGNRVDR